MPKKKAAAPRRITVPVPAALSAALKNADALREQERYEEAQTLLEDLIRRYPNQQDPLRALAYVAYETDDLVLNESICERLIKLVPHDADVMVSLTGAYISNARMALAIQTGRRFLQMAPRHERAEEVRELLTPLEAEFPKYLAATRMNVADGLELAGSFERAQSLLERGEYRAMRQEAQKLLTRIPDHAPTLNNIGQSYYAQGDIDNAIVTARSVLDTEPENVHALANLTHYAVLTGYWDEAREFAADLKASKAPAYQKQLKIAEALSYLGDYAGVLAAFAQAEVEEKKEAPYESALLLHLAGAAAARLGKTDEAKQYWKRALTVESGFDLARGNLSDLNAPIEERHGAWAFTLPSWLLSTAQNDLRDRIMQFSEAGDEEQAQEAVRTFFKERPEAAAIIPTLLERGDPGGRQMALLLARSADTPDMLNALKEFALGQNGPDAMRMEAFRSVSEANILADSKFVRLWLRGAWQEVIPMNFEITDEPQSSHTPEVQELIHSGMEALQAGDTARAEELYQKALEQDADSPVILNNLAAIFSYQGRKQEYEEILHYVHEQYPDYFLGRTNMAMLLARENKVEEAKAMIAPLSQQRKIHTSDFAALCMTNIEIQLAAGEPEDARRWLGMWEQVTPEHPRIENFRSMIETATLPNALQKLLQRGKGRGRKKSPDKT